MASGQETTTFSGKSFAICGFPSRRKLQLQDDIKGAGGAVVYSSNKASYLVAPKPPSEDAPVPHFVTAAKKAGVPVVGEEFVRACLSSQTLLDHEHFSAAAALAATNARAASSSLSSSHSTLRGSQSMDVDSNDEEDSTAAEFLQESTETNDSMMDIEPNDEGESGGEGDGPGTDQRQSSTKTKKVFDPSAIEANDGVSHAWRTANVFISSTFRDMHGERDWLTRRVFPELQERCNSLRVTVSPVDLRWGVTDESSQVQVPSYRRYLKVNKTKQTYFNNNVITTHTHTHRHSRSACPKSTTAAPSSSES